jgi:hypothetical protein
MVNAAPATVNFVERELVSEALVERDNSHQKNKRLGVELPRPPLPGPLLPGVSPPILLIIA